MSGYEVAFIAISTAMAAAGTAVQASSQASAARYNAKVAEQNAEAARRQADADAERQSRTLQRQLARRRTAFAASGVSLEGSPLDLLEDLAIEGKLDVLGVRQRGLDQVRQFSIAASRSRAEASNAEVMGLLGTGQQLASGLGRIASLSKRSSETSTKVPGNDFTGNSPFA